MSVRRSALFWALAGLCVGGAAGAADSNGLGRDRSGPVDLDGDGVVTVYDLAVLFESMGATSNGGAAGDVNGDGMIDREDVRLMLDVMGGAADSDEVYVVLEANGMVPPIGMSMSGSAHHPVISASNPYPPGGPHDTTRSSTHPNHGTVASSTWPHSTIESTVTPGIPQDHQQTLSDTWPSNHQKYYSNNWPRPGNPTHDLTVSAGWPPNHQGFMSESWPGPDKHESSVSFRWPPNHESADSSKGKYPHQVQNSDTRKPNHDSVVSAAWPNNHRKEFSNGWPGHQKATSQTWPPNHLQVITATWDQHGHLQATSQIIYPPNWHTVPWSAAAGGSSGQ